MQIATLLFAMLGQAQAKVTELKRRADALQPLSARHPDERTRLELRLSRAQHQQTELSEQLSRAERERDIAQQVADHAARRIHTLENELAELRFRTGHDDPTLLPGNSTTSLLQPDLNATSHDEAALDDVDRALEKVRAVLDEEHAAVQQAADDVGFQTTSSCQLPTADAARATTVPGHMQRSPEVRASSQAKQSQSPAWLSRTTTHNWRQLRHRISRPWRRRGGMMQVDLRERLRVQSKLPNLPRGWHREMALRPAQGKSFSGDFVVAARTNSGRTLEVALTDVSGKGADAVSRAVLLSGAFSGLLGSLPPRAFLPAANSYFLRQDWDEGFATSIYLTLDLDSGDYELFSAGHLPGLQFNMSRNRWEEKFPDGPLLGLYDGAQFHPIQGSLRPGDVLLLYTDGLVETSGRDISEGIDRLVGEADHYMADGFHGAAWHLIEAAAGDIHDDRALLLIGRREE